jgi:catechol 2,3-dioxygenase-like lactoylglutathione lyase family enzyme
MSNVNEIRFVAYGVPDLDKERAFYSEQWGLRELGGGGELYHFAADGTDELYVVRLRHSEKKRVDLIGLATGNRQDVDNLHAAVKASGCRVVFEPRELTSLGGGYGFRFFSTDGLPFEISSDVARGETRPIPKGAAIPEKISHIVLHSPKHKETTEFFVKVLGFRLSDWLGDFMSFLRCNEWHHRIAILPGPPCLNHVAYDMTSVDEMMRGVAKLKRFNTEILWGPGRHTAGNNTFSYFATPNGFAVEYTSDLERVNEEGWVPTTYVPKPEIMDQWGTGIGGPHTMPHPEVDKGLFEPSPV